MTALDVAIGIAWLAFWVYWLTSAVGAKSGSRSRRARAPSLLIALGFVLLRALGANHLAIHSTICEVIGAILFASGLGLAIWARIHLGRNWGMPMTRKDQPELVTSGPYRRVRHPIYSGILLAVLGTALAINILWLVVLALLGSYFIYSATVEERMLTATFPTTYPSYRARTKMLIPFVV